MTANRRSKVEIYCQVLDLFRQESAEYGKARLTKVAHKSKIPYDRFQKIVSSLVKSKLIIRTKNGVLITSDGLSCLQKLQQANAFLREIGLSV